MVGFRLLPFFFAIAGMGWSPAVAQDVSESGAVSGVVREPRSLHQRRLCRKYGICEGQGGFQGGYQGYQGGYNPQQGYPPINIAISQSQASANEAGGGYSNGYYPNNYQYNGYPNHGHGGYGGNQRPGYFGNGQGAFNNQFNGNYYGAVGGPHGGGYGFQGPAGGFYDEGEDDQGNKSGPEYDNQTGPGGYDGYQGRSNEAHQNNFAAAGSFAAAGKA